MREKIAQVALSKVGSTHWSFESSSGHGPNTYKCNYFIYDVGNEAGAKMPTGPTFPGPIGAGDGGWGDSSANLPKWSVVQSPQRGDVVGAHNERGIFHAGIYVGGSKTVSANAKDVGHTSWPFGKEGKTKGFNHVYRRYDP